MTYHSISKDALGKFILRKRNEKGISREELADRLCVSYDVVWRWETGKRFPDFEMLDRLAGELGVTVQELYDSSKVEKDDKMITIITSVVCVIVFVGACIMGVLHGGRKTAPAGPTTEISAEIQTETTENETPTEQEVLPTTEADTDEESSTEETKALSSYEIHTAEPRLLETGTYFYGNYDYTLGAYSYTDISQLKIFVEENRDELGEVIYRRLCEDMKNFPADSPYYYLFLFDAPAEQVQVEYTYDKASGMVHRFVQLYQYDPTDLERYWIQLGFGNVEVNAANISASGCIVTEADNPDPWVLGGFYMATPYWITKGATVENGIMYKEYPQKYIPSRKVVLYKERDVNSQAGYFDIRDYYCMKATDRENWIYMEDPQGRGGWLYIEKDQADLQVMTEDGWKNLFEAFITTHDGEANENVGCTMKVSGIETYEKMLENTNFAYMTFENYEDMLDYLKNTGAASEDTLETMRQKHRDYVAELSRLDGELNLGNSRLYVQRVKGRIIGSCGYYDAPNDRLVLITGVDEGEEELWVTLGEKNVFWPEEPYSDIYNAIP